MEKTPTHADSSQKFLRCSIHKAGEVIETIYRVQKYKIKKFIFVLLFFIVLVGGCNPEEMLDTSNTIDNWMSDWGVAEGYSIIPDTDGFLFPTAIVFVPNPGNKPKDPLYFIAELRGSIRVVTNDRSVYTFADDFIPTNLDNNLALLEGQFGVVGLCLEPKRGYLFATLSYSDASFVLRNIIVRFTSTPEKFSIKPISYQYILKEISNYSTAGNHQIGACQIVDDQLFIGFGDGNFPALSQDLGSFFGKILRLTLDGKPYPENPFYNKDDGTNPRNFVWAYGLRNPFGLKTIENRVFAADNGSEIDRFIEVQRGENYYWQGSDWDIGARADAIIAPAVGPTHLEYIPEDFSQFDESRQGVFMLASSGSLVDPNDPNNQVPGIISIRYDLEVNEVTEPPSYLLRYQGTSLQAIVALALGPDGLYFAPLFPDQNQTSSIYRIAYQPSNQHPYTLEVRNEIAILRDYGCLSCHKLNGNGGINGPVLDWEYLIPTLETKLHKDSYISFLDEVDQLEEQPYTDFFNARQEIRDSEGKERVKIWLKYHIFEPRFDNPVAQMPNLGLKLSEAQLLADYLSIKPSLIDILRRLFTQLIPILKYRYLVYSVLIGIMLGVGLMMAVLRVRKNISMDDK